MKFLIIFLIFTTLTAKAADSTIYLPNIPGYATGTTSGSHKGLDINISSGSAVIAPNTNGLMVQATVTSGAVTTFTAPANAVGFMLESSSANTVSSRWAAGATAPTTSTGLRLEQGRDTGFIPMDKDLKVIAESGTAEIQVQWVLSQ